MSEIKNGVLHCHTTNSIRDSVMSVNTLVTRAKELGAPAVALTDHGSMTGYIEFMKVCQENEIKPILGVEAYVEEEKEGRKHLILMAKDYTGFQALIKAVSESNTRVVEVGTLTFPRMNKGMLAKYFGPGSSGHGHVIATSACVSGVLASIVLANASVTEEVDAIKLTQQGFESPTSAAYLKNDTRLKEMKESQKTLSAEIAELKKEAGRSLLSMERKALNAPAGSEKQRLAREVFNAAQEKRSAAAIEMTSKKQEKEALDKKVTTLNVIVKQSEESIKRWRRLQVKIDAIEEKYISDDELDKTLSAEAMWYQETFGAGDFYIELQNHGMKDEKRAMTKLAELSDLLHIPVCLANDVHIPAKTGDDILARAIIRTTAFDKWSEPTASEKELYIKTDTELTAALLKILPPEKVQEGFENIGEIVSKCNLVFPKENHYPKFVTPDGSTPEDYLRKMTYDRVGKRYPDGFHDWDRLEHELDVICSMGYADYHCIVEDFLRYARAAGKLDFNIPEQKALALSFNVEAIEKFTEHMVGECVGPGRGSAAGSVVCYIIGITNIDPLKYGLLFERFLNPDRVSMPDIDCDIESNVRPYVIEYVKHKYGEYSVCGIMARGTASGKAAIQTGKRVYGIKMFGDSMACSDTASEIAKKAVALSDDELHINLAKIKPQLEAAFAGNKHALEIIHYAALVEGCTSQISQHAAGIIVTDGKPVDEYVPLIYSASNGIMMTQCDMNQAENIGLLKIDFLGLNNLTIITETLREVYKNSGKFIDMDKIRYDEKAVFDNIFKVAMTNSVFQLESDGMKKMLQNFKPDTIFDLILLVAMYRPGPIQYLPNVIAVKNGQKEIEYLTKELEPILGNTYGSIVYQEEVQEIFKQLAGYSLGQADIVRRAMSKKKDKILKAERNSFLNGDPERNIPGCIANHISEKAANALFDEMTDFAKYAFNKSHAACYAVVAYQTAWLKYHYPREYMKSVLNNTPFSKIPGLVSDLRFMGIDISAPDVNRSELKYCIKDGKILFGLGMIKGLGESVAAVITEREKNGPFQSLSDFVIRTDCQKKILENMTDSGAFDCFCNNRTAISELIPDYVDLVKKIKTYRKKLAEAYEPKKINSYTNKLAELQEKARALKPDLSICEDRMERLKKEKDSIGVFASENPITLFPGPEKIGAFPIAKALEMSKRQEVSVMGMISNFAMRTRHKDGAEMGFFTLTDASGEIDVCCFTEAYALYAPLLSEDAVVRITGEIMIDRDDPDKKKLSVKIQSSAAAKKDKNDCVTALKVQKKTIVVYVNGVEELEEGLWNAITPYVSQNGNPVKIYDLCLDQYRKCGLIVSPAILGDKNLRTSMVET